MIRLFMAIKIANRALSRNLMRSILTMLGVIIGVGAVIAMVAIGQGAHASIRAKIASLGANSLVILPGSTTQSGVRIGWGGRATLRPADVKAIQQECPAIAYATASVRTLTQVVYANQNWATNIHGTGIEYPNIREWPLVSGGWFTQQDVDAAGKVAVLGQTVADWLFGSMDPVGQVIQMKNMPFKVIGLLTPKGQSTQGQDQDDIVFIPYTTAQKKVIGITHIHSILASAVSNDMMGEALEQITALLRQRHRLLPWQDNDFSIRPAGRCGSRRGGKLSHHDAAVGEHRVDFAVGRRHRHHEYHAGIGDRAHAGDRYSHGRRREKTRYFVAIPGGSA